jgi:hypothetical protein
MRACGMDPQIFDIVHKIRKLEEVTESGKTQAA